MLIAPERVNILAEQPGPPIYEMCETFDACFCVRLKSHLFSRCFSGRIQEGVVMEAFWTTFGLVFLMEMGDKSQLVIMALATRYKWQQVAIGVTLASLVTHGLAVLVGGMLGTLIPMEYVKTAAALAFLGFAFWTLRSGEEDEEDETQTRGFFRRWPAFTIAATFLISEFGDKTQLTTVAAAAKTGLPIATWLGAASGMVAADAIGIAVGRLLQRVPSWIIRLVSASVFLVFGWSTLVETWAIPELAGYTGMALLPLLALLMVIRQRQVAADPSDPQNN